jgi:hypothetical protein
MTNADRRTDMWRHALVMSLQTRGVPGDAIGDAVAEVDVYCADSGEGPWQAFGDPFDYASRVLGEPPRRARADAWRVGLAPGVGLAGVLCLMAGVAAISHGSTARLTVGSLVAIAVVLVAGFLIVRYKHWLVRGASPWRLVALYLFGFAGWSIALVAFGQVGLRTSGWHLIALGAPLFILGWRQIVRMSDKAADRHRVVDPRTGDETMGRQRRLPQAARWAIPMILLMGLLLAALLPAT